MVPVSGSGDQLLDPDPFVSTCVAGITVPVIDNDLSLHLNHFGHLHLNRLGLVMTRLNDDLPMTLVNTRMVITITPVVDVNTNMVSTATAVDLQTEAGAEARVLDMQTEATSADAYRRAGVRKPLSTCGTSAEDKQKHPENACIECCYLSHDDLLSMNLTHRGPGPQAH